MGSVTLNPVKRRAEQASSLYGDYYENEEDTFKSVWRRIYSGLRARYKSIVDREIRQKHRTQLIREQLRQVGLHRFDLLKPETFFIADLLKSKEKIDAAICGHIQDGSSILMVITDRRVLYLNIIPFFTTIEEIGYGIVEAVSVNIGQFDAIVSMYTGAGKFTISGVNLDAATRFVDVAESLIEKNNSLSNQK